MDDALPLFPIALRSVILECRDLEGLCNFYTNLLGWKLNTVEPDEWMDIVSPGGTVKIAFQADPDYLPPTWPDAPGAQQMMAHLDFTVRDGEDMTRAVRRALSLGAKLAATQYDPDAWMTLIDPEGHPFCFVVDL